MTLSSPFNNFLCSRGSTYIEKRIGPKVDTWGTPKVAEVRDEEKFFH